MEILGRWKAVVTYRDARKKAALGVGYESLSTLPLHENRHGHDEPFDGLEHPEPCLMETLLGVAQEAPPQYVLRFRTPRPAPAKPARVGPLRASCRGPSSARAKET